MSDGEKVLVFKYISDEISFTADEFIGLTLEQADKLYREREIAYLRS